jgi:hypothetical protein
MKKIIHQILKEEVSNKRQRFIDTVKKDIINSMTVTRSYNPSFFTAMEFLDIYNLSSVYNFIDNDDLEKMGFQPNDEGVWVNPETGVSEDDDEFMLELVWDHIHELIKRGEFHEDETGENIIQTYPNVVLKAHYGGSFTTMRFTRKFLDLKKTPYYHYTTGDEYMVKQVIGSIAAYKYGLTVDEQLELLDTFIEDVTNHLTQRFS